MEYRSRWAEPPAAVQPSAHQPATHPYSTRPELAYYAGSYLYDPLPPPAAYYTTSRLYDAPPGHFPLNVHPTPPSAAASSSFYYHHSASAPNPIPRTEAYPCAPHGGYEGFGGSTHGYTQAAPPALAATGVGGSGGLASYYSVGDAQSLALKQAIRHSGAEPSYGTVVGRFSDGLEPTALSHVKPAYQNHTPRKQSTKNAMKKVLRGGTDQPAYCEVCKIDCTSQEVLRNHKLGKKHKKKLQMLQESVTPKSPKNPATMPLKEAPAVEKGKALGEKTKKRTVPATPEELEAKKKRVLEGGAAAEGIRVCTICNVVVNSQQVLNYHLSGQKHAAMVKKQQATQQDAPVS